MRYPCVILPQFCQTEAEVTILNGMLNEDGEMQQDIKVIGKCNFQSKAYRVLDENKSLITLSGKALFTGDLCPEYGEIPAGSVKIHGAEYQIYKGSKLRNPDGTVNYTELELR